MNASAAFRPMVIPGVPGTPTPWMSRPPPWIPPSQKKLGMLRPVWGPPRRIG